MAFRVPALGPNFYEDFTVNFPPPGAQPGVAYGKAALLSGDQASREDVEHDAQRLRDVGCAVQVHEWQGQDGVVYRSVYASRTFDQQQ